MDNKYWQNKRILITGGTSGLGKALAIRLLELGAKVAIVARTKNNIDKMIEDYPGVIGIQGDLSKKEQFHPLAGEINIKLGDVDHLFNVASYLGKSPLQLLIDTECEDFEEVLQTNLLGPFRLTKLLLPSMILNNSGVVVNISSDAAVNPYSTWGGYSVSKAGVDHMSRIFQEELEDQGVKFLSIDPGDMNTPMHFAAIPDANPSELRDPNESAQKIIKLIESEDFSQIRRVL